MLVLLLACSGSGPIGTIDGSRLVDWKANGKTSMSDTFLGTPGTAREVKSRVRFEPKQGGALDPAFGPIVLDLTVSVAPTPAVGPDGSPHPKVGPLQAPQTMIVDATEAGGWALEGDCDEALAAPMPGPTGYSAGATLWINCSVRLQRAGIDDRMMLEVMGDGTVKAQSASGTIEVMAP